MAQFPSVSGADGIWTLTQNRRSELGDDWPSLVAGASFSISPSFDGKSSWDSSSDGNLNIGSHGQYTITPNATFTAVVKMWGGGGARGFQYTENAPGTTTSRMTDGGGGGYTTATMVFNSGTSYILRIGEGGAAQSVGSTGEATYVAGGIGHTTSYGGSEGGGYSGIFEGSVTHSNSRLIAGGGGGGGDSSYTTGGGAGGGTSGQDANDGASDMSQAGYGGSSSAGGNPSQYNDATAGGQLTGGFANVSYDSHASMGGGGGGFHGGGGGNVAGGGGGSGYVHSSSDITNGSTTTGSGGTPANSSDTARNGAGTGGSSTTASGSDGRIILEFL